MNTISPPTTTGHVATVSSSGHGTSSRRSLPLDVLRAIAVLLVIGMHTEACPPDMPAAVRACIRALTTGGWVGVDLFFVLSGFLVSGLLFREHRLRGQVSLGRFFLRRGLKIYPAFWFFIGSTVALRLVLGSGLSLSALAAELLFVQNYFTGLWTHTWSLAVEEHFYLALPFTLFALWWMKGNGTLLRPLLMLFAFLAAGCLLMRLWTAAALPNFSHKLHHFPTHLRIDSLFFGVVLSYLYHYHASRWNALASRWRFPALVLGCALLVPAFLFPHRSTPFIYTFGFTLFYIGAGLILASFVSCDFKRNAATRLLALIGANSYSIYLWHTFIAHDVTGVVKRLLGDHWNWSLYALCYWAGAVIVGIGISLLVELPILRLRDRLFPSRAEPSPKPENRADGVELPHLQRSQPVIGP